MTVSIMIDLETWGKRPGCDLRSIGACVFATHNRHGDSLVHDGSLGTIKPFYIATDNPRVAGIGERAADIGFKVAPAEYRKYPLHRDPETVQWWSEQSDEAQAAFTDPVDLRDALERFTMWLNTICTPDSVPPPNGHDIRIWSHGPQFDISILAAAYEAVGLPVPWHYRAPRDTRTAFDLAGIDDHTEWLKRFPGPLGIPHHALDDAICQARAVCAAYGRLAEIVQHGGDYFRETK